MGKRKSSFTVSDVKRAVAAVSGTGLTVFGVTISTDGSIRIETAANGASESAGTVESPYERWKTRRAVQADE